jgi:hypothetical protein
MPAGSHNLNVPDEAVAVEVLGLATVASTSVIGLNATFVFCGTNGMLQLKFALI